MQPLVSICVPIYNVAPYIERCIRSLMEQTYENLEFIFVDDCSTDNSVAILQAVADEYPERKEHIRIRHNDHNSGLAYTRRVTIENAKGEFIVCVDSDDYAESNMVACLLTKAIETNADIIQAGYVIDTHSTETVEPCPCQSSTDYVLLALTDSLTRIWCKLIRRCLFAEGRSCYAPLGLDYLEDRYMLLLLSTKVESIATVNKPLYHYTCRENSVSQGKSIKHLQCLIRYWQEADALLAELGLTEKYQTITGTQKLEDKAHLLMFCDNRTRKKAVSLFADTEKGYTPSLSRGVAWMYWLTKHRLWVLTYCYERYIAWLSKRKRA